MTNSRIYSGIIIKMFHAKGEPLGKESSRRVPWIFGLSVSLRTLRLRNFEF